MHALNINDYFIQIIDTQTKVLIWSIHRSRRRLLIMSVELSIIVIGLLSLVLSGVRVDMAIGVYNVKDYGAIGDGQTDNTKVALHVYYKLLL